MVKQIDEFVAKYLANPLFSDAEESEILISENPFRRPMRVNDSNFIDYCKPLTAKGVSSNSSLPLHMGEWSAACGRLRCPWHKHTWTERALLARALTAVRSGTRWTVVLPAKEAFQPRLLRRPVAAAS